MNGPNCWKAAIRTWTRKQQLNYVLIQTNMKESEQTHKPHAPTLLDKPHIMKSLQEQDK